MLYDLRAVTHALTEGDLRHMADRVRAVGGGRARGPVGIVVGARPEMFRMGLMYAELTSKLENVEVSLTSAQLDAWLARNARRGSSRQP
jgi:hypothetical protein